MSSVIETNSKGKKVAENCGNNTNKLEITMRQRWHPRGRRGLRAEDRGRRVKPCQLTRKTIQNVSTEDKSSYYKYNCGSARKNKLQPRGESQLKTIICRLLQSGKATKTLMCACCTVKEIFLRVLSNSSELLQKYKYIYIIF